MGRLPWPIWMSLVSLQRSYKGQAEVSEAEKVGRMQ